MSRCGSLYTNRHTTRETLAQVGVVGAPSSLAENRYCIREKIGREVWTCFESWRKESECEFSRECFFAGLDRGGRTCTGQLYSLQPVRGKLCGNNWHVSSKASVDKIRTNGLAAQLRPRFDHVLVIFTFAPHAFAAMQTMRDSSACSADVQPANISPQLTALSHDHSTHRLLALWRRRTTGTRFKRNSNA